MTPARIAELLQPFLEAQPLSPAHLYSISTYIDILRRWNARINLTAIRDPEEIVTRHFGESFFAARHLFPVSSSAAKTIEVPPCPSVSPVVKAVEVADLGSGAGFPGIPIKLWAPHISLTLIESNHKKSTFLREVVRALTLTGVNIQNARAETLPAHVLRRGHSARRGALRGHPPNRRLPGSRRRPPSPPDRHRPSGPIASRDPRTKYLQPSPHSKLEFKSAGRSAKAHGNYVESGIRSANRNTIPTL